MRRTQHEPRKTSGSLFCSLSLLWLDFLGFTAMLSSILSVRLRKSPSSLHPHLLRWQVRNYFCPACKKPPNFKKWSAMMGHWNSFHKDELGDLSARECRIQNLRNATCMSISMTEQMTVEIARNMAAVTDGEGSSIFSPRPSLSLSFLCHIAIFQRDFPSLLMQQLMNWLCCGRFLRFYTSLLIVSIISPSRCTACDIYRPILPDRGTNYISAEMPIYQMKMLTLLLMILYVFSLIGWRVCHTHKTIHPRAEGTFQHTFCLHRCTLSLHSWMPNVQRWRIPNVLPYPFHAASSLCSI